MSLKNEEFGSQGGTGMINKTWIWALVQLRRLARDERGANMVEYALVIAIAILIVLIAVRNFANAFVEAANFVSEELGNALGRS